MAHLLKQKTQANDGKLLPSSSGVVRSGYEEDVKASLSSRVPISRPSATGGAAAAATVESRPVEVRRLLTLDLPESRVPSRTFLDLSNIVRFTPNGPDSISALTRVIDAYEQWCVYKSAPSDNTKLSVAFVVFLRKLAHRWCKLPFAEGAARLPLLKFHAAAFDVRMNLNAHSARRRVMADAPLPQPSDMPTASQPGDAYEMAALVHAYEEWLGNAIVCQVQTQVSLLKEFPNASAHLKYVLRFAAWWSKQIDMIPFDDEEDDEAVEDSDSGSVAAESSSSEEEEDERDVRRKKRKQNRKESKDRKRSKRSSSPPKTPEREQKEAVAPGAPARRRLKKPHDEVPVLPLSPMKSDSPSAPPSPSTPATVDTPVPTTQQKKKKVIEDD